MFLQRTDIVSAVLTNTFVSITVTFRKAVDSTKDKFNSSNCKNIFLQASVDKFGNSAKCTWDETGKVLTVKLGNKSTIGAE
jgi:hypothetical protein